MSESFNETRLFVLESEFEGEVHEVAHGVSFPTPHHRVVINWTVTKSLEVLDSVDDLHRKFGDDPEIRWVDDPTELADDEIVILGDP